MKKIIGVLLMAIIVCLLPACGGTEEYNYVKIMDYERKTLLFSAEGMVVKYGRSGHPPQAVDKYVFSVKEDALSSLMENMKNNSALENPTRTYEIVDDVIIVRRGKEPEQTVFIWKGTTEKRRTIYTISNGIFLVNEQGETVKYYEDVEYYKIQSPLSVARALGASDRIHFKTETEYDCTESAEELINFYESNSFTTSSDGERVKVTRGESIFYYKLKDGKISFYLT